jgi:maleate isomerase
MTFNRSPPVPDTLGYRKRIGIVVPSTNTTVQPESEMLRPRGVTNHVGRSTIKERPLNTEAAFFEHMEMMREGMTVAIDQIMTAGLDHLIIGIALETFWGGVAAADKLQAELATRAGVGISMGGAAAVAALKAFGARRIAVLTPHQPRGDAIVRAYLQEAGFDIVRLKGLAVTTPRMIAQVPLGDIRTALKELDGDDIDALLQVGTALPTVAVAAEAERWLGKPVLAINTVTYWHALRQCGIEDRVFGYGRVLEEF